MKTALLAALALSLPAAVAAQSARISPSFAASEVYDGNLFAAPNNPKQSLIHRFGPRLELDARDAPFSMIGKYTLDADYVQALPEQGLQISRQLGSLQLRYVPMDRLTLDADGFYLESRTLVALNATPLPASSDIPALAPRLSTLTAIDRGRLRATMLSAGPSVDYQIARRTRLDASYVFTHDSLIGLSTDEHVANAALSYQFTRVDTGSTTLIVRKFVFEPSNLAPSEVVLLGWRHAFLRRLLAEGRVGPRFRNGVDGIEGDGSLRYGFGHTDFELVYTRAETITLGLPGSRDIDQVELNGTVKIKPAQFRAAAGTALTHGSGVRANYEYLQLVASTLVQPWLTVELSASLTWQQLRFTAASSTAAAVGGRVASGDVFHDVVALTLIAAPPKPLEW